MNVQKKLPARWANNSLYEQQSAPHKRFAVFFSAFTLYTILCYSQDCEKPFYHLPFFVKTIAEQNKTPTIPWYDWCQVCRLSLFAGQNGRLLQLILAGPVIVFHFVQETHLQENSTCRQQGGDTVSCGSSHPDAVKTGHNITGQQI